MKINFTINSNIKLEKTLCDLDVNYGVVYYSDKTHDTLDSKQSFFIKLLGKIESVVRTFKKIDIKQQQSINAVAQVIDYSNTYMIPESIDGLRVHINTKSKTNEFYENALIGITKQILDFGTKKASYLYGKKMILLGTSSLENTFSSAREKFSITDISQFIFFHELSHSLEKFYKYNVYKDTKDTSLSTHYNIFMTKLFLSSTDKYVKSINEQIEKYKAANNQYTIIIPDYLKNIDILACENYADVSGLLHLRNYKIRSGTYNNENFIDFIESIAKDRALDQQKLYLHPGNQPEEKLTSIMLSIEHFTTSALLDLTKKINGLNNELLANEEIHSLSNKTTESAMLKMIFTLSKTDEIIEKMFYTCCESGMQENELLLGSSYYGYDIFQSFLKTKLDIVWLAEFNHSLFIAQEKIKDPQQLKEACFNIFAHPEKYKEQLEDRVKELIKENLTTDTVKEKISNLKTPKIDDINVLINKI